MGDGARDAELVERARRGDERVWREIVDVHRPRLRAICAACRIRDADADDVENEVWAQLFVHLHDIRDPSLLRSWLGQVCRRRCYLVSSRARREQPSALEMDPVADLHEPVDGLLRAESCAAVNAAMSRLPERSRRLLDSLAGDAAPDYGTISARERIPVGSIGPTRMRTLAKLRRDPAIAALAA